MYYKLEGKLPVPCDDLLEWAVWFENFDRRVVYDEIGDIQISTVFLGLDHNYWGGRPILFETMIFSSGELGNLDQLQKRYCTWEEAEDGHQEIVALAKTQSYQN